MLPHWCLHSLVFQLVSFDVQPLPSPTHSLRRLRSIQVTVGFEKKAHKLVSRFFCIVSEYAIVRWILLPISSCSVYYWRSILQPILIYTCSCSYMQLLLAADTSNLLYSGKFSGGKNFANFVCQNKAMKMLVGVVRRDIYKETSILKNFIHKNYFFTRNCKIHLLKIFTVWQLSQLVTMT